MDSLFFDLRSAVRSLTKRGTFTAVAVLTLGLGIGASTTMFTLLYRVVLSPLPYEAPEELVFLNETNQEGTDVYSVSIPNFFDWRERNRSFEALASFRAASFNHTGQGEPARIRGAMVSANFFDTLGVEARLGRTLEPEDEGAGEPPVVLSHGLWQSRFGSDPHVLGDRLVLDGRGFIVRGVMPPDFLFLSTTIEMWLPMSAFRDELPWDIRGRHPAMWVVGRLSPGVGIEAAREDMRRISLEIDEEFGHPTRIAVRPLHERVVGRAQPAFAALMAAVALLLLIACGNVANLLLARAATRRTEMATRAALGASRRRLVRQLLTESLLLAMVGGGLGLLLSSWGVDVVRWILPSNTPRFPEIALDGVVSTFALAIALGTGILFGLAPVAYAYRSGLSPALRQTGTLEGGRHRLRSALVVMETALAVVLLVGAGLMLSSLFSLTKVDTGFRTDDRVAARFALPQKRYPTTDSSIGFYQEVLREVRGIASVEGAAVATGLPLVSPGHESSVGRADRSSDGSGEPNPLTNFQVVSPGYFETMGIELLRGRFFDSRDREGSSRVAIVDETFAETLFPGEDPIGHRLNVDGAEGEPGRAEIVGVVRHVLNYQLTARQFVQVYVPLEQPPDWMNGPLGMNLIVRSREAAATLLPSIRARVRAVDPLQPIYGVTTLEGVLTEAAAPQRLNGILFGIFAAIALFLASVGLYGVLSSLVQQSTRAIGLRVALGARPGQVIATVMRRGIGLTASGVALGLLVALVSSRWLASLVFGVSPFDPRTYGAVVLLLLAVAGTACLFPAWKAMRVQAVEALRYE